MAGDQTEAGVPLLVYAARVRVLCVGAGHVAASKVWGLLDGGAAVTVIAPYAAPQLRQAAASGRVRWTQRAYQNGDIADAQLVLAASDSAEVNAAVAADADAAGRLCVRVDRQSDGSAGFMGAVRRGPLLLAVSTSGTAPGLTRAVRAELEDRYGPEYGALATLWGQLRKDRRVRSALAPLDAQRRHERWQALYGSDILSHIRAGNLAEAKEAAVACLLSSSD